MKRALAVAAMVTAGAAVTFAQQVISAKSGLIHYAEGRVLLADRPVEAKIGNFPDVKENATLRTEAGRVEVLLTPGVFLRLGENSGMRMLTNRLIDTRLEFLSGSAVIEANEIGKDNAVTVVFKDAAIHLVKKGLYRLDSNPAGLRVFDGEASVETAGNPSVVVHEGRKLALDGQLAVVKFDRNSTDALDRWSRRRGEYVAMANISAANSIRKTGHSWASSGWAWNPYFGMYTFIPMRGSYVSPYGFRFWSPLAVGRIYMPRPVYYPGFNDAGFSAAHPYPTAMPTSSGYSGTMSSATSVSAPVQAPSTSAAAASSAPVSHSGGGSSGGARK